MTLNLATVTALVERYGALQHPREVLCLLDYLERDPPSLIIEVGVWRGGNAAILGTAFPSARIIGVDMLTPASPEVSDSPSLGDAIETFGIELVTGDTRDPVVRDVVQAMIREPAGYLFLDASHDTASVLADYALWSPLAKVVGFHDVHNPMVFAAWLQITGIQNPDPLPCAMWKEPDGHGIGVVLPR